MSMGLNLKDEETLALVTEVAQRLGLTKTGAVRELARARLAALDAETGDENARRHADTMHWLETEVWPRTAGKSITKEEIEDLMGYNEMVGE